MSGRTTYFGMSYFDFRDRLDTGVNIQKEIDRFLFIDKQLYGLYSVFGNGVIEGWDVTPTANQTAQTISVVVSPGIGIIESIASETVAPFTVKDLPSNQEVSIYAVLTGGTLSNRRIEFVASSTPLGDFAVRVATVVTASNGVSTIDLTTKDEISFLEIIQDEIASHRHRGSPTKIDLQQEVKNQLPGARVEDFDASKIATGRLDAERIPILDHNDLDNTGLLSHAALDSFARSLTSGNRELLGEVASVNLLKHIIFLKYLYPRSDEHLVNTIPLIPGVSPNSFIDFDASTAHIDLVSQCISGKPITQGEITSIFWENTNAFLSAVDRNNVTIANDEVTLTRGGGSSQSVENFESVPSNATAIPGFSVSVEVVEDNLKVVSDNSDTLHTEGFYSGKFSTDREFRALYTREITQNKDWSLFDELVVDVKSLSLTHGAIFMYFVSGEGENEKQSPDYLLLGEDEITTNPDPEAKGFERRAFSIDSATRNDVRRVVIYTDDTETEHVFWIDNIFLRSQSLYPETGFIRFRYSGGSTVLFNSVNFISDVPEGTELRVRVRTANSPTLLNRASFTPLLNSGDVFARDGTDAEIDIVFVSNNLRNKTPTLTSLELQIIVTANEQGFIITNADDWDRGSYINTEREDDSITFSSALKIRDDVEVGNIYFSHLNNINEVDTDRVAQYGVSGSSLLLSPKQAIRYSQDQGRRGFKNAFSVYRLITKNYIIADTDNDRVLEFTAQGEFVRGVGSHNIVSETLFYPLTAVYNPRTGILSVLFSKSVAIDDLDIEKVRLWIGGVSIDLSSVDTVQQPSSKTKRIVEFVLSNDKVEQLQGTRREVFVQLLPNFLPVPFETTESSKELVGNRGLSVFVGDFVYMDGINHPVFANETEDGNWIIGNSSVEIEEEFEVSTSVITVKKVSLNDTIQFQVEVDEPATGATIVWESTIPTQVQGAVSFSAVSNIATITVSPTTNEQVGEWTLTFVAKYQGAQGPIASTQTSIRLVIAEQEGTEQGETAGASPSVTEIDVENETVIFSYDEIKFSDYSLGSIYEVDENFFLVAGIVEIEDFIPGNGNEPSEDETFEEEAARVLEKYRGKVLLIERSSKAISAQYDCPDGSYASDAVLDDNGYYVVAETTFASNSGRVVRMDNFFNIVWQIGGGMFSKINDVRSQHNNNVVIST
jgi:hypothetical protein